MNIIRSYILLIVLFINALRLDASIDTTKVLFIGNSITYYNNMPQIFRDLANNKGENISISVHAPGGSGIVNHYVNTALYNTIKSKKWDVVIIQPGSSESAGISFPVDTTVKRARILLDSIYKYNECTKVYLYEIPYGIPSNGGYNKYFTIQQMFRDSVTKMADKLKLQMLPAGECVRAYYSKYQNMLLHSSINNIHPNANGSFMIASSFYAGIFQDSIFGASYYSTINVDTAKRFFNLVDSIVLNNKSDWRINTYNLHAEFSFVQNNDTVHLFNSSTNFTNVLWNFGDGSSSSLNNSTHIYSASGDYQIKLKVSKQICFDTANADIIINIINSFNTSKEDFISCYPNPVTNSLYINADKNIEKIYIYDISGKLLFSEIPKVSMYKISVKELTLGTYIVCIHTVDSIYVKKILKL